VFALLLALALPSHASAGQPFTLDSGGRYPHVAVGEDGTGHFVWQSADGIAYCQVPRGGTACTKSRRWTGVSGPGIEGPRVLLHRDGRIIVIAEQVCDRVALISTDGGANFSEPTPIASGCFGADLGFRAELGPGENTVSYLTGGLFKAAPLDGPATTAHARLGPVFESGLAFVDPLTPIVALSDLKQISFRRYDGSGDYNDPANWTAPVVVGNGEEPDLAGGVRGVYLSYESATGQAIRRFDAATGSFAPPQTISEGETNSGDLYQSATGSLHQSWTRPGAAPLEQRRSLDGVNWLPTETLADDEGGARNFFHQHVATAGDGGGFAVWDDTTGGDARAVEIVPNSGVTRPDDSCRVQVGLAVAIAREGCFQRQGSLYTAPGEVRINGIDLSGAGKVTIDVRERSLRTSAPVTAKVGNVALGSQRLDWRIPTGPGAIKDSAGNEVTFDAAKANSEVLALLVSGWTTPRIVAGEAVELPVNLELPAPLSTLLSDKATGSVTLRASNLRGLELANATIEVKGVSIGIAEIERFNLVYQNLDPWIMRGTTAILLPVARTKLNADFGLKGGDFDFARGNLLFDPPRPLTTLVLLRGIHFDTNNRDGCKTPAKIAGGVTLTLISEAISRIEGDAYYKFPLASCKQPGVFRIDGKGFLRDLQVADMYAQYVTPKAVTFGGGADVNTSLISAGFRVDGAIDVPTETFFVEGKVSAGEISDPGAADDPNTQANEARPPQRKEIVGASVIVSSIGLRACTEAAGGKLNLGLGFHQRWGEDTTPVPDWPFFEGCEGEAGDFKPAGFKSTTGPGRSARASQASSGFRVGRGVPFVNLRIEGSGGPQVVVRGPGGRSVTTRAGAPELTGSHAFAVRPEEELTYVRIFRPTRGRWTVTPQTGSTITRVLRADGLPKPEVRVHLGRARRGQRQLSWQLRRLPGQRVRLFERGTGGAMHALRTVSQRRGKLRFTPALGLGRRRQIVGLVESRGVPRESLEVAHFTAPADSLPSRPNRVSLKRANGNRLVIRWSRSRGATRYAVNLRLRDGRRVTHVTPRRRLVAGDVPAIDGGAVSVAGLRADNLPGPARQATLKPRPKLELSARGRQRLGQLTVVVGCGGQACHVVASGTVKVSGTATRFKLRPASAKVSAGERKTLRLKLTRSASRKLTELLRHGRRALATVAVGPNGASSDAVERVRVRLTQ
jgi:hypothetical protein